MKFWTGRVRFSLEISMQLITGILKLCLQRSCHIHVSAGTWLEPVMDASHCVQAQDLANYVPIAPPVRDLRLKAWFCLK